MSPLLKTLASAVSLLMLVQALGVQLLCFCGSCPTSRALGIAKERGAAGHEVEHACCYEAGLSAQPTVHTDQARDQVTDNHACCAGEHSLQQLATTLPEQAASLQGHTPILATLTLPSALPDLTAVQLRVATVLPRGPPGPPPVPLWLDHQSLLI